MRRILLVALLLSGCGPDFDRAKWRNADLDGRARAEMLPSLLRTHPLKGMTRQQVVDLLGEPTDTNKWRGADMIYVLGNDGGLFPIDHEWLLLTLDRQGRVISFERVTD